MGNFSARFFLLSTLFVTPAAIGAEDLATFITSQVAATPQCTGGIVADDGTFESGYAVGTGQPGSSILVQKLSLGGATQLDQACVCFARSQSNPGVDNFPFELVVYDDDGGNGTPGTLLGSVNATATSVPIFPNAKFFNVDLTSSGINLPGGNVYVGARWDGGPSYYMCGDRSPASPQREIHASSQGVVWTPIANLFGSESPRALGIRVDPDGAVAECVTNATTLCLGDGRFRVTARWDTNSGEFGDGRAVTLTTDTGYFWFFDQANVELVTKVLDACDFVNRFWVFAGGLTDVHVALRVLDTQTGVERTYVNPQGTAFQPIQDTSAFATCP